MIEIEGGQSLGFAEAGAGERLPMVFLHGVGSDKSVWAPQLAHFGAERRAIAFDYPGYGDSDPAADGTGRDDYARAIFAAMTRLDVPRAHICGLSLGGVVAIAMATLDPDRCASLILADTFASHPDGKSIYHRSAAAAAVGSLRPLAEARVDVLLAQPADPAVRHDVIETMSAVDPAAYLIGAQAVWLADQGERAHAIRCPVLVLCGDADKVTPPALSSALTKLIPGAMMELVDGAGHLANLEQPAAFNALAGGFVRGVDSHL
ncbi:MAG: alpha/beta fold hydrolase [Sphingomicrobium sp.]